LDTDGYVELYSASTSAAGTQIKLSQTGPFGTVEQPTLTSDGSRVIYTGNLVTLYQREVFSASTSAPGTQVKLSVSPNELGNVLDIALSPDNSRVAFRGDMLFDEVYDLWSVSATTSGQQRRLGRLSGSRDVSMGVNSAVPYQFTPDGAFVVYGVDVDENFTIEELYAVDVLGNALPILLSDPLIAGGQITSYQIAADGRTVVYRADQDAVNHYALFSAVIPEPSGAAALMVAGAAGAVRRRRR
jgi:Tol biopolymer transport system component